MSKRNRILTLSFLGLLFLFVFQNFIRNPNLVKNIKAADITVSGFTTTNTDLLSTNNTYTFTFTQPTTISPGDYNNYGVSISSNQYVETNASFCDATLSGSTDDGSDFSASWNANQADQQTGVCSGGTVYIGSSVEITAGSTIVLTVTGVKNPGSEGPYYPYINDSENNYSSSATSSQTVFGTPVLKVKVTEPDGTTAVADASVWIHNSMYNKSAGTQTDVDGNAYFFENTFWLPDGVTINDTYTIEASAPSGNDYTDPAAVPNVSLAAGSTVDYTAGPLGPILLTRPILKGTFKVPAGCTTCLASAGSVIPNVEIDIRDSSFNPTNFKNTRSNEFGVFTLGGVSAGTYIVEFRMPWDAQNYLGLVEPATLTNFEVKADGSITYGGSDTPVVNLPRNLGNIEFLLAKKTITGTVIKEDSTPVSGAMIQAMKMMEHGMAQTTTDANGEYTLTLGGGNWMIMPQVDFYSNFDNDSTNDVSASWIYCGMPKNASFADDDTEETSTGNNFTVRNTTATITGIVTYPDGTPLTGDGSVDIFSKDGCGTFASIDWADGSFSASVPTGTYNVSVHTWNQDYGSPASTTVTVSSGTTDLGTLSLTEKNGTITGRLWADTNSNNTYDSGEGVGNITVEAFKMAKKFDEFAGGPGGGPMMGGGGDWSMTQSSNSTDNAVKGTFTLKVTNGTWIVNVMADPGMMHGGYSDTAVNYLYTGSPGQANISDSSTTSTGNNFELSVADATIQGRIVDSEGAGISGIWGYAFAEASGTFNEGPMMGMGMGSPISNSSFTLKVPAGDYRVGVDFPPETAGYTAAEMATVTTVSGETVSVDVTVIPNNATVRVQFKDSDGDLITDLAYAEVFMDNGAGGHQWRMLNYADLTSGYADVLVSAGSWNLGYHIDPTTSNYMSQSTAANSVTAVANDTVTMDITLKAADSTVAGIVSDPDGNPLPGVWISTDSRKAANFSPMGGPMFMGGEMTAADGSYSLTLPAGTYQVAAFFPPSAVVSGQTVAYLNPEPKEVTINSSTPATANFTFGQSDATLTGSITLDGSAQGAFITAYSNKGAYNETTSVNGSYSLSITSDATWYVKAMYESGNDFYLSSIYEVVMGGSTTKTQDMALAAASFTIPDPVSTTLNCANAKKISLSNGTEVSIPASAIVPSSVTSCDSTDSSSNITISLSPTAQMSIQDKSVPVGVGYEITAKDSNGAAISTTFNSNVTITIPYTDDQITSAIGGTMDESLLGNGYWDTSTSTWRTVDGQVVDTVNNTITISTNHFTLFGVLAATDPGTTSGSSDTGSGVSAGTTASGGVSKPMAAKNIGNIVTNTDNHIVLMIPQGALQWDTDFSMSKLGSENYTAPKPPLWIASGPYRTIMKTWWNSVEYQDFEDEITLIFRYDPTALGQIPEKSLRLNYYDEVSKRWRPISSLLITDRHEVAAVVSKLHRTYALIGGYGYQGSYAYTGQTVTADSNSEEIGIQEKTVPKEEVKKEIKHPTVQKTEPQPAPQEKLSFWQKIVKTVKSFFSR